MPSIECVGAFDNFFDSLQQDISLHFKRKEFNSTVAIWKKEITEDTKVDCVRYISNFAECVASLNTYVSKSIQNLKETYRD